MNSSQNHQFLMIKQGQSAKVIETAHRRDACSVQGRDTSPPVINFAIAGQKGLFPVFYTSLYDPLYFPRAHIKHNTPLFTYL